MEWFWLALTIGLVVVELATTDLITIWFACGAGIAALLSALINSLPIYAQLIIFISVSVALLVATRPLAKRLNQRRSEEQKTNLDLLIGKEAIVTEAIDNMNGKGAIKINGAVWSARSENGNTIEENSIVIFKQIKGNKAIVELKGA